MQYMYLVIYNLVATVSIENVAHSYVANKNILAPGQWRHFTLLKSPTCNKMKTRRYFYYDQLFNDISLISRIVSWE